MFGTDWKSPRRWVILGVTTFVLLFGLACYLIYKVSDSVIKQNDDSPLTLALSPEVLQAAFDKKKQSHMLSAEFKFMEAEKAEKNHDYATGHKAYADSIDEMEFAMGTGSHITRLITMQAGVFESDFYRWKMAQNYFEKAIKEPVGATVPQSLIIGGRKWLAASLEMQGLYDAEIKCRNITLSLARAHPEQDSTNLIEDLSELGNAQVRGDDKGAMHSFNEAVALIQKQKRKHKNDERDAEVYVSRAYYYLILQQYAEALSDLNIALQLTEDDLDALAYRGVALFHMGRNAEALSDFDKVLQAKQKRAWVFYRRGKVYSALKEHDKAISDYENAAALSRARDVVIPPETTYPTYMPLKKAAEKALEEEMK